jgi:outer membrane protein TolC
LAPELNSAKIPNLVTVSSSNQAAPIAAPLADVAPLDGNGLACFPLPAGSLVGAIAFIFRGTCTFETKLNNAQAAGAVGALVYDNNPGEDPITMGVGSATLPAEMVRQRPDILAAEATLHSACAQIGVATAALLPNFTLSGDIGRNVTNVTQLFGSTAGTFWSYGATASQPLFAGGTRWFQRKAAIEAYQASLSDYRQVVVSAYQQVADTLKALEHDAQLVKAQAGALRSAKEALDLVQANYQSGLANYLQVIVANNQYQQALLGYISAQALRLQDTAALFVALGGGWWNGPATVVGNNLSQR